LEALNLRAYWERGVFSTCQLARRSNANFIDMGIIECRQSPTAISPDIGTVDKEMVIALAIDLFR
jgi:hypothetical protein